jgi:hypothetical protein
MKLLDLLLEVEGYGADEKIITSLKNFCNPYIEVLKKSGGKPLYRGYDGSNFQHRAGLEDFKVYSPNNNRVPKDTSKNIHDNMNKYFVEKFGQPFRNGISTSPNRRQAYDYGDLYVVFPIGKLEYVWSHSVDDLTVYIGDLRRHEVKCRKCSGIEFDNEDELIHHLTNHVKWSTRSVEKALMVEGFSEVMFMNECILLDPEVYKTIQHRLLS